MYLTWLADVARETGYPVYEVPGWKTRGHGQMRGAHGVVTHWTAGPKRENTSKNYPSLAIVRDGRSDLPGPLSQLGIGFDGTIYVIAAGVSWHAGNSSWKGETNLNYTYIGIEAESPGNNVWTAAQKDVYVRLCAALMRKIGRSAQYVAGHKEVALPHGRKPDAAANDMNAFRVSVQSLLNSPGRIKKVIPKVTPPVKTKPVQAKPAPPKPTPKPIIPNEDNEMNADEKESLRQVNARTLYLQEMVETLQTVVFELAKKLEVTTPAKVEYNIKGEYPKN